MKQCKNVRRHCAHKNRDLHSSIHAEKREVLFGRVYIAFFLSPDVILSC